MRQITVGFGVELDWLPEYARLLGAKRQGDNLLIGGTFSEGTRFVYQIDENISFIINDSVYTADVHFKILNKRTDFLEIHYNLSEDGGLYLAGGIKGVFGRRIHNLSILDSAINGEYIVKKGMRTFLLSIFIKKDIYLNYLKQIASYQHLLESIFHPSSNVVVRSDRMTNRSWWLITELRKMVIYGDLYRYFAAGTVYLLLADYMEQIKESDKIQIDKATTADLDAIFDSQMYLITLLKGSFPGIDLLAERAHMSATKYKNLFKKITSHSPNSFFLQNKLASAKEMLEKGGINVTEVASVYGFSNTTHFSELFKSVYNLTPKDYINQLK